MDDAERAQRLFQNYLASKHLYLSNYDATTGCWGVPFMAPTPTVFTTDLPVVKRDADEPLIAPDVAAYLAEWFAR